VCHVQETFASRHHHILAPTAGINQLTNCPPDKLSIPLALKLNPRSDLAASSFSVAEHIVKLKDRELRDRDILKQNKKISNNFLSS